MNLSLVRLEAMLLRRSPVALAMVALVALLCAGALATGAADLRQRQTANAKFLADARKSETRFREMLVSVETGAQMSPMAARPMAISRAAALDDGILGDFSAGAGDLYPSRVRVRLFENSASLFENYQFGNPTLLRFGGFDMSAIVIVLMPLLMIALCFDTLGADRDTGRIKLTQLCGVSEQEYLFNRLAVRSGALWLTLILATFIAALLNPGQALLSVRLLHYVAWLGGALLYGGFWFLALAWVVRRAADSGQAVGRLIALWVVVVLIAPALVIAAVQAAFPAPSRLAYLSDVRAVASRADEQQSAVIEAYQVIDPELHWNDLPKEAPFREGYLRTLLVEKATIQHRERFDRVQERRADVLSWLQLISPAIAADTFLAKISSGDVGRYQAFQADARALLATFAERLGHAILKGERISVAEYDKLPTISKPGEPLAVARSVLLGSAAILALFLMAVWTVERAQGCSAGEQRLRRTRLDH
jgi:ABC-2 type transport system permease protein